MLIFLGKFGLGYLSIISGVLEEVETCRPYS